MTTYYVYEPGPPPRLLGTVEADGPVAAQAQIAGRFSHGPEGLLCRDRPLEGVPAAAPPAVPLAPTEQFYALVNFRGASSLALKCALDAAESAEALAAGHDEAEVRALFGRLLPTLRRAAADLEQARVFTQPVVARAYAKGG